jgi:polypeptide N-acetylgalactosaminyltransferase
MLSKSGEIRRDDGCLDYSGLVNNLTEERNVLILRCHGRQGNQEWIYNQVS